MKWGAKWDKNKNRPYFEGQEDVVIKWKEFIDYFIKNKDKYYYADKDENNNTLFNLPLHQIKLYLWDLLLKHPAIQSQSKIELLKFQLKWI